MAFLKSNPERNLQRDVAAARSDCATLTARLDAAEKVVVERKDEAERLACDNADDAVLEKAEAAVRVAQDHVKNLRGGLSKKQQHLADLERDLAALIDARTRRETAAEVATMATDLENAAKAFDTAIATLAEISGRAAKFCPDAVGLQAFASSSRSQVPPATELIVTVMRNYATAVLRGDGPATLPKPEGAFVEPVTEKPPTVQLFCMRPVKWRDAAGVQRLAQKFTDVSVTQSAASRGVACGALVPMESPLRRANHNTVGGNPDLALALDLDAEPVRTGEPGLHEAFEQPRIG